MTGPAKNEAEPAVTDAQRKQVLKEIKDRLDREENKRHGGARHMMPKEKMLDLGPIKEKNPDKHYRYVNTSDPAKAQTRVEQGYVAVSEDEAKAAGVRHQVGEGRLMAIPREAHEERVEEIKEVGERRLKAHKVEVHAAVEAVARELRDRHGIDIPVERLFVDE